jgi:hypothetical protein
MLYADPFSERVDQTGYFGQWNETIRWDQTALRVAPAGEAPKPTASEPEVPEWSLKRAQHETNGVPYFHSILGKLHRDLI